MNTEQLDIRSLRTENGTAMWAHLGQSDRLVVCFSGIGTSPNGAQPYEFARTATGNGRDHALFISDTRRSWLNAPGLIEQIVNQVEGMARAAGAKLICTLGHSMGGFMALVLPAFTRVDRAVAFSPQVSVHPDIVGDDPRWMEHREKIDDFRIRSVNDHLNDTTDYFLFHGRHMREAPQRDRFELSDNMVHFVFESTVHEVPQRLKRAGVLDQTANLCFRNRRRQLRHLLAPLGAHRRKPGDVPKRPPSALVAPPPSPDALSLKETTHDQV